MWLIIRDVGGWANKWVGAQPLSGRELDVGAKATSVDEGIVPFSPSLGLLEKLEVRVLGHSIWC